MLCSCWPCGCRCGCKTTHDISRRTRDIPVVDRCNSPPLCIIAFGAVGVFIILSVLGLQIQIGSNRSFARRRKNISLRCALGCGKKVSSQKPFSSLQSHEIQTAAIPIKRRYELHPGTQTTSSWFILGHTHQHQHTLHCTQASCGCHANPALVVHALEGLRLCCSILLMRDNQHNTQQKHFTSLCPAPCIKPTV